MSPDLLTDVRAARASIADPANWCRRDAARERRGYAGPVCAAQAVRAAVPADLPAHARMERTEAALRLLDRAARHYYDKSLVGLNDYGPEGSGREVSDASDEVCYDAVMCLLDRAELHLLRTS